METILLVILIILALALIAVVLVQRSEGGALGMGGGPGGLFSTRGSANLLTRVTAGLATAFMILSLILVILEGGNHRARSVMDAAQSAKQSGAPPSETGEAPAAPKAATDATGDGSKAPAPESDKTAPTDGAPSVPQTE